MNRFLSKITALATRSLIPIILLLSACAANKPIELFDKQANSSEGIALLTMPVDIDVVYFDGVKHTYLPAYQEIISYSLLPGDHIIGLVYQNMVENEEGDLESLKSKTVVMRFMAKAGEIYNVNFDKPVTFAEAVKLEKNFQVSLSNKDRIIATSTSAIESPVTDWVNSDIKRSSARIYADINPDNAKEVDKNLSVGENLVFLWKKASDAEKMQFKNWINSE